MKKLFVLFMACASLFVSCSKDNSIDYEKYDDLIGTYENVQCIHDRYIDSVKYTETDTISVFITKSDNTFRFSWKDEYVELDFDRTGFIEDDIIQLLSQDQTISIKVNVRYKMILNAKISRWQINNYWSFKTVH